MTAVDDGGGSNADNTAEFVATVRRFESCFVRVPFEQFRRAFRQEMRIVERELPALEALINKHDTLTAATGESMRVLGERVTALKSRFAECRGDCELFRGRFVRRMEWVNEVCERGSYQSWARGRLLRLIGDYLVRRGDMATVRQLIASDGAARAKRPFSLALADALDLELTEAHDKIVAALEAHRLEEALAWCGDHRPNLKKLDSNLEFRLRQQEFVELLRAGNVAGAVRAAQRNFAAWTETNYADVRETMALLCWFPYLGRGIRWGNGTMGRYETLVADGHWRSLVAQFRADFVAVYGVGVEAQLVKTVRTGLSVLKTRQCAHGTVGADVECPVCSGPLSLVARTLPFGHYEMSRLRCRITGLPMDADNPPLALPNGQVYSAGALTRLAGADQTVRCPVTGAVFPLSDARKCFIL